MIEQSNFNRLKEMFSEMVEKKNIALLPDYYHSEFLLYSNGVTMDYTEMLSSHEKVYQTAIAYRVEYDEESIVETADRLSLRLFITITKPEQKPVTLELVLIALYKGGKLYRVWETVYPDWSQMEAFQGMV